jgi:nucleoside-diphosphate-sugar epimerase
MQTVVTGGAGFIGSYLVRELVKRGFSVKVIDNLSTGKKKNIEDILGDIEFIEGDIRDINTLNKHFEKTEVVFHQAALPSVPRSINNPIASNDHNVNGTLNVLVAARDKGVKRVIYASSSSAYGNTDVEYKTETLPSNPLSPYALTKFTGEVYCKLFTKLYGLETVSLRYFNVFGPRQDPNNQYAAAIPLFINLMLKGESPTVFGNGEQSRDFTYVKNNVEANIAAALSNKGAGETINIACGESITLDKLISEINANLKTNIKPIYKEPRVGDVKHSKADIKKAESMLGYKPSVYFADGLRETIEWYKNQ